MNMSRGRDELNFLTRGKDKIHCLILLEENTAESKSEEERQEMEDGGTGVEKTDGSTKEEEESLDEVV